MRIVGVLWRRLTAAGRASVHLARHAGAAAAANPAPVLFAAAGLLASIGFALAWLPLGLIVPGVAVCSMTFAWRWKMAFGRKDGE